MGDSETAHLCVKVEKVRKDKTTGTGASRAEVTIGQWERQDY